MSHTLVHASEVLRGTLDSPWLWITLFLVAGCGGLLPFTPSQTSVVAVGSLIGPDPRLLTALAAVTVCGVVAGDCAGYGVGRRAGPRLTRLLSRGGRGGRLFTRVRGLFARHATALVVAGRFLPGGRVSSTLAAGSVELPVRRFLLLETVGALLWTGYVIGIGVLGGASFAGDPAKALSLALGVALVAGPVTAWLCRRAAVDR
jgi:membrane-associated protein